MLVRYRSSVQGSYDPNTRLPDHVSPYQTGSQGKTICKARR